MNEIQKQIVKWHNATFPNANDLAILIKLKEESFELYEQVGIDLTYTDSELTDAAQMEIADVIIVACSLLARYGIEIEDIINAKMDINHMRNWGEETPNGDRPRMK